MGCVDLIFTIITNMGGIVVGVISGILVERYHEKRRKEAGTFVILNNAA
jgi:hypothetical protein